ncbi:hypothetical protein EG68_05020 [Paragonimus skrjabini miyazakii]|uniref:Uncharacterized protein n=1 Tax=Paragonimus skrjabini miyazakii TaxID=59628 RepID=A0A8S9Z4T6_9TREM|nr:hypothetical protein EG68_05020 [Paragonimus skrjabini miyazakii]
MKTVSVVYTIPRALSIVNSLDSVLTIDQCRSTQFCSIRNNSTIWIQFYFWNTVNSIDTTSFTICHKVIGSQQYHELCTQDFVAQLLDHPQFMYRVGMNLHVDFPNALVGRWYTLVFNSTGSLWFSSSLVVGIIN